MIHAKNLQGHDKARRLTKSRITNHESRMVLCFLCVCVCVCVFFFGDCQALCSGEISIESVTSREWQLTTICRRPRTERLWLTDPVDHLPCPTVKHVNCVVLHRHPSSSPLPFMLCCHSGCCARPTTTKRIGDDRHAASLGGSDRYNRRRRD